MQISKKTTGLIKSFFASKEAYPILRQLEKIRVKKAQAKVVKCAKNKCWVPRTPLGHLSVKVAKFDFKVTVHYDLWAKCTQLQPQKLYYSVNF